MTGTKRYSRKSSSSNNYHRKKASRGSRGSRHSSFFNFYKKNRLALWIGGAGIIALYVWLFYYFFVGPMGFRWRALYGDAKYPEGYEIHGIDISHYQGKIDWDELQNGMIEGCPIRFIIMKSTEGASRLDDTFYDNFENAREYGFIRGAYHFWTNKSSAREQAYWFLKKVHLQDGDLPPVISIM